MSALVASTGNRPRALLKQTRVRLILARQFRRERRDRVGLNACRQTERDGYTTLAGLIARAVRELMTVTHGASTSLGRQEKRLQRAGHGIAEYARWHLGIDADHDENTKGRYKSHIGDFPERPPLWCCGGIACPDNASITTLELAVAHPTWQA